MPLWATVIVLSVVTGTGAFIVKFLMRTSEIFGKLEQAFVDWGRRLSDVETWQSDRDAEMVAYRNNYSERPRTRRR